MKTLKEFSSKHFVYLVKNNFGSDFQLYIFWSNEKSFIKLTLEIRKMEYCKFFSKFRAVLVAEGRY